MALASTHHELDDLGGGRFRHTQHMKPIAYRLDGNLRRSVHAWAQGDASWPHTILDAPMLVYTAADGMRRICPTRDPAVYVEIGAPYIKPATTWNKVNLGAATRSGNTVAWTTAQARVEVVFGGHFVDLGAEFLGGWTPPNSQIAFPVGMQGLVRDGYAFTYNGQTVLTLKPFIVKDLTNPSNVKPVTTQLVKVGSQWYALATLPSLAGMARPYLDPQLSLQPDGTDGKDTTFGSGGFADNNYATLPNMNVGVGFGGTWRGVIAFNLSTIPTAALITSATLTVYNLSVGSSYATSDQQVSVYRIMSGRDWVEAEATWNIYKTGSSWTTAGCSSTTSDRENTAIGAWTYRTTDANYAAHDIALTPGATGVQGWTSGALTNNGMLLKMDTEGSDLYETGASDSTEPASRPKLVIDYTLPATGMVRAPGWGRW